MIEQELLGANTSVIPGDERESFSSTLIDTIKAKEIRRQYELAVEKVKDQPEEVKKLKGKENYSESILDVADLLSFNNSTVAVLEAKINKLNVDTNNQLNFKVVVTHNEQGSVQMDDYLDSSSSHFTVSMDQQDQGFLDFPAQLTQVSSGEQLTLDLTKGRGNHELMILLPQNKFTFSDSLIDSQVINAVPRCATP